MNASRLILAFLVLLGLAVGLTLYMGGPGASESSVEIVPVGQPAGDDAPAPAEKGGLTPTAVAERAETGELRAPARLAGWELIVSLELPAGAPLDPELAVLAVPQRELQDRRADELLEAVRQGSLSFESVLRAPVQASTASLSLPDSWQGARLMLDGRFLYLDSPMQLEAGQTEARLAPKLGACLVVHLKTPANADTAGAVSLLGGDFSGRRREGFERRERDAAGADELVFRGLNPELSWTLTPDLKTLHGYTEMGIELEAGRERSFELELTPGVTVAGEVLDDQGRPRARHRSERDRRHALVRWCRQPQHADRREGPVRAGRAAAGGSSDRSRPGGLGPRRRARPSSWPTASAPTVCA